MFEIIRSSVSGTSLVSVSGDLDLSTLSQFRSEILRSIDESGPSMILDVSAVDVFETVALGVIFEAVKRSRSRSGSIVLVNPSDRMSNDLEITGACRILDVTLTVQDAVARLQCVSGG